jgi:DedD protein
MRLPFLRPKDDSTQPAPAPRRAGARGAKPAVADEGTAVELARTQARRRLMGALVLLAAGVVGFPLLFETQPRPLVQGLAPGAAPVLTPGSAAAPGEPTRSDAPRTETPAALGRVASGPVTALPGAASAAAGVGATGVVTGVVVAAGAVAAAAAVVAAPASAAKAEAVKAEAAKAEAVKAEAVKAEAAKAQAKQAGAKQAQAPKAEPVKADPKKPEAKTAAAKPAEAPKPDATAAAPRYVVQVGAFNDATRMRDARNKVEKLGFKTYTSEVNSSTGRRTRVRLGPFATKKEADAAAAKVKTVGLPADVLTL